MLTYIILTYLLCLIGGAFYWMVLRNRLSSINQKTAVLSVLFLSLIVPLFFVQTQSLPNLQLSAAQEKHEKEVYILEESVYIDFCPVGEVLETCYQQAVTSNDFCNCEEIAKENLLVYQESSFYNFLSWQETAFWKILFYVGLAIGLFVLINVLYLQYLIFKSKKETRYFDGKKYTILHPHRDLSVASFRLINRYIIWQDEMDGLSKDEQNAILWHETAHIHHFDTWIKIFVNLLQVLWLINPAYYFLRKDLDRLSEYIADEWAVNKTGNARQYANLLFKIKSIEQLHLAQRFNKSSLLKQRIQHILNELPQRSNTRTYSLAGLINVLLIAVCFSLMTQQVSPRIDSQIDKLKIYQTLSKHNGETGRTTFCKVCMEEELKEACLE